MRFFEALFLLSFFLYHTALLVPRYRRYHPLYFLAFAAALFAGASLGFEGLRWQNVPALFILIVDLVVLLTSFSKLHGQSPVKGFWRSFGRFWRTFVASIAFLFSAIFLAAFVMFPLPSVPMTGGIAVAQRHLSFQASQGRPAFQLRVWYPTVGSKEPRPRWISTQAAWAEISARGGPSPFFLSDLEHLPTTLIEGGKLPPHDASYAVILFSVPNGQNPEEFGWLLEDLASRGYVVAAGSRSPNGTVSSPKTWLELFIQEIGRSEWTKAPFKSIAHWNEAWLQPEEKAAVDRTPASSENARLALEALRQLNRENGDAFYQALDFKKIGLLSWRAVQGALTDDGSWVTENGIKTVAVLGSAVPAQRLPQGVVALFVPTSENHPGGVATSRSKIWELRIEGLHRADLTDSAYLRPYLVAFNQKGRVDGLSNAITRNVIAAYFQYTLWNGDGTLFEQNGQIVDGARIVKVSPMP